MTRLFEIGQDGLIEQRRAALDKEDKIEAWVKADLSLIGVDGIIIAQQLRTGHGKIIDLLAIDQEGNLVIIELKRDRSPRDVVGQLLDYASWVHRLSTKDVYELVQREQGRSLSELYTNKFSSAPPEILNASHQMIVVASEVDEESKRIIEYLSEVHDIGINAAFFNVFQSGGKEMLTTDSLLDQTEVVERSVKKTRPPWSGYYYLTGGAEEDRPWEDMRKHGFFSAHGGTFYTKRLNKLRVDDPVFYYQKQNGYLGFGSISQEKQHVRDFKTDNGEPILDVCKAHYLTEYIDDEDNACYLVGVNWSRTFSVSEAKYYSGIFANQNVVCGIYDPATVEFLKREFSVES